MMWLEYFRSLLFIPVGVVLDHEEIARIHTLPPRVGVAIKITLGVAGHIGIAT